MTNKEQAVKDMDRARAKVRYKLAQAWRENDIANGRVVTIEELSAVADLALVGGVPDGSFSDAACEAWCTIRRIMTMTR